MRYEDVWLQGRTATLQSVFLFLTQFLAYLTIVLRTQRIEYLLFYAVLQDPDAGAPFDHFDPL